MIYRIYLSNQQKNKLKTCFKKKKKQSYCRLKIELNNVPNTSVRLNQAQINKIKNAKKKNKKYCEITLSLRQNGGFLTFLAPLLPLAAKAIATGALGALGSKVIRKITGKGTKIPGKKH